MRCGAFFAAVVAFTLPFMAAAALAASADEGSSAPQAGASPPFRPPDAVLRHVDAPRATAPSALDAAQTGGRPELVILVGGYQSCACPDDGSFDALRARLADVPDLTVVRFGTDPRFPYDTYGAVDPSARNLRDQIRSLAPDYGAIHIVTHSMGGVVADRAFANGLSASDGVATYVSWSSPHSGSDAARAIAIARMANGGVNGALRESLLWLRMESDSPAVRDLANVEPVPAPSGVVRLDLREASDLLVTERDARDPGVPSRVLTRAVEGHGGILTDPEAIDLTLRTITAKRVPPDERSAALRIAAQAESDRVGNGVFGALCVLTVAACVAAVFWRIPPEPIVRAMESFIPRASRKPCP